VILSCSVYGQVCHRQQQPARPISNHNTNTNNNTDIFNITSIQNMRFVDEGMIVKGVMLYGGQVWYQ
jgi:hypothetical protein